MIQYMQPSGNRGPWKLERSRASTYRMGLPGTGHVMSDMVSRSQVSGSTTTHLYALDDLDRVRHCFAHESLSPSARNDALGYLMART